MGTFVGGVNVTSGKWVRLTRMAINSIEATHQIAEWSGTRRAGVAETVGLGLRSVVGQGSRGDGDACQTYTVSSGE